MEKVLHTLVECGTQVWLILFAMGPYLLFGFLVAGLLSVFISPEWVERHLGGHGFVPVLKAALFGVPLPLCSCGVIPVAASLRRHGASRGATAAFLLSTPQTGVDSIVVTYSLLGPVFAILRPVIALVSGLLGGTLISVVAKDKTLEKGPPIRCTGECCGGGGEGHGKLYRGLRYGFWTLPRDIGKALLLGLAIAAAITALVPGDYFASRLQTGIVPILVLMAVGIPIYVCATASVPVALALIVAGVSPGAALAFLITGPATNAATIATIWKIMGGRTAVVYLLAVAVTAVGAGLFVDNVIHLSGNDVVSHFEAHEPVAVGALFYLQVSSAVVLMGILVSAFFKPSLGRLQADIPEPAEKLVALNIEGMTCSHCLAAVKRTLLEQPGVKSATVDFRSGEAVVSGMDIEPLAIASVISELGYPATVAPGGVADAHDTCQIEGHNHEHKH